MGFGFSFFILFILLPLTGVLLLFWIFSRDNSWLRILGVIGLGLIVFVTGIGLLSWLVRKTELSRQDYSGSYIIDRRFFPGRQADWQYNHFRFEIRDNDSIYFHQTEGARIVTTYRGHITTTAPETYSSLRLVLNMDSPTHHIVSENPTTYRSAWNFHLVFQSPLFNNVYFRKGKWKPLED
jgi:hypothetical protein